MEEDDYDRLFKNTKVIEIDGEKIEVPKLSGKNLGKLMALADESIPLDVSLIDTFKLVLKKMMPQLSDEAIQQKADEMPISYIKKIVDAATDSDPQTQSRDKKLIEDVRARVRAAKAQNPQ